MILFFQMLGTSPFTKLKAPSVERSGQRGPAGAFEQKVTVLDFSPIKYSKKTSKLRQKYDKNYSLINAIRLGKTDSKNGRFL